MQDAIEKFMRLAIGLARNAEGQTFPNPLVGAVVVKDGRVIGSGYHKKAGGPHAEVFAIRKAGKMAQGAELYCTFEPCAHHGRTGPCVEKIIRAKIGKVYCGMIDPNPLVRGKGLKALRKAGIRVEVGLLKDEIRRLNEPFISAMTNFKPFVTVKIAESIDGKTATRTGESKWITSVISRVYAHKLRRSFDGIMVGINTVKKDDPGLECLGEHSLTKIIVDSGLDIPLDARLFKTKQRIVIASVKRNRAKEERLIKRGARVIYTGSDRGRVDLRDLLKMLNGFEIRNILVEGGSELIGSFLDKMLADKALVFIAPKIIGGRRGLSSVGGEGAARLKSAIGLKDISLKKLGPDILIEGYLQYR